MERLRLDVMKELKACKGPFTSSEEVNLYLDDPQVDTKEKQKRMKKEVQFARDSSTTLPRVSPIFKIQVTGSDKKRRDKTATEFGEALLVYLASMKIGLSWTILLSRKAFVNWPLPSPRNTFKLCAISHIC